MAENIELAVFKQHEARFEALKGEFSRLDAEADKQIVRWRYALDSAFELQADYFRRMNEKPGKLIDDEPISAYMFYAYGYDAQERIIYAALFQTEEVPGSARFYAYHDDGIEMAAYHVELFTERYHLAKVARLTQTDGKPLHYGDYTAMTGQVMQTLEAYHYDDQGRMARVAVTYASQSVPFNEEVKGQMQQGLEQQRMMARMFGTEASFEKTLPQYEQVMQDMFDRQHRSQHEERYEYEGDNLKRIVSHGANQPEFIRYEAPRPGETEEDLFESARASLRRCVVSELQKSEKVKNQRLYNLVLDYDAVADDGVLLHLGTEVQRQKWKQTTQDATYESLIMDNLGINALYVEVITLPDDFERLRRDYRRDQRWDDIRKLFVYVARDLNDYNWTGILDISEDFIVYANDHEAMDDPYDEIRECVPEHKLQILRAKGLLLD